MCNCLWNSWWALKLIVRWKHELCLPCKHTDISICAQRPRGLKEVYRVYKQKPSSGRREGCFTVILSSTTLDKGLAVLKLAVTSKHSLWCSSYSFDGNLAHNWCSERTPNPILKCRHKAKVVYKCMPETQHPWPSQFLYLSWKKPHDLLFCILFLYSDSTYRENKVIIESRKYFIPTKENKVMTRQ